MKEYRSLSTIRAVQYLDHPIPGVVCDGTQEDMAARSCDATRSHLPHAHTIASGGMTVLKRGDWIIPVEGGPFLVVSDDTFRADWDVAHPASAPDLPVPGPVSVPASVSAPVPLRATSAPVKQLAPKLNGK